MSSALKRKILLLDDDPGFCRRIKGLFASRNIETVIPVSPDEARKMVASEEVGLLIHGSHHTETYWDLCKELRKSDPILPTLHIESHEACAKHRGPASAFHDYIRQLAPDREIVFKARRLWVAGQLHRKAQRASSLAKKFSEIDSHFLHLDSAKAVSQQLRDWAEIWGAGNVIWLAEGDTEYFLNEMWKVEDIVGSGKKIEPKCWKPITPQQMTDLARGLENKLSHIWRTGVQPVSGEWAKHEFWAYPVRDPVSGFIQGQLIVLVPTKKPDALVLDFSLRRFATCYGHSRLYEEAKGLSYIDDVTLLFNQRYLNLVIDKELSRAKRTETNFSVLFLDIDYFKKVNDSQGHLVGSKLLVQLADILKQNIRTVDYGFRYGGDEFMLILTNTDSKGAHIVGERIRKQVEAHEFLVDSKKVHLTVSIGIASFPEHATTREEIIHLADQAMYYGKNRSRNTVFVAS